MKKVLKHKSNEEEFTSLNKNSLGAIYGGTGGTGASSTDRVCAGGCGSTRGWSQE